MISLWFQSRAVAQRLCSQKIQRNLSKMTSQKKLIKVQVKQGLVIGNEQLTPNGTVFHSYKGIPYSIPPVGKLRFQSPVPLERFSQPELDCTKEGDVCQQRDPMTQTNVGSEDCLFLNIYAPQRQNSTQPLPVLVYIHGGGFFFGSGNSDYYFPQSLMDENVIVVTFNYRLGVFGFLCLPEAGIWGNVGLKDQRLALQWVQENIAQFNGDPNNVTIFGESAGAASVHLHTYAEHANKLFHKAIMQSGTANMEWVFQNNSVHRAHHIAELLGCQSSNANDILKFLQSEQITSSQLLAKSIDVITPDEKRRGLPLPFKPVIENIASPDKFLVKPIIKILQHPNITKIPTIMGYNSGDGMIMLVNAIRKLEQIDNDLERFIPRNIPLSVDRHKADLKELASKMRSFYFRGQKVDENQLNALCNLLTDYHFAVDMQNAAKWQADNQPNAPLYFYHFDYVGHRNIYKYMFQFKHLRGACHGDELFYIFQVDGDKKPYDHDDYLCVQRLCRLWANFARFGKPTVGVEEPIINFDWTPVRKPLTSNDRFVLDYLDIGKECKMRSDPDCERIEFWQNIYKNYTPIDYSRLSAKL